MAPGYEEWRLAIELPEETAKPDETFEWLRSRLPAEVDAHRKGRGIRLYAGSRTAMADAETVVASVFEPLRVRPTLELTRWNPGAERWQSPELPVEAPRGPLPVEWSGLDEAAWEVRVRYRQTRRAQLAHAKLREQGAAVIRNGKRLMIGVADEEEAHRLAGELRKAPTAAVEIRPLSRWRIWLLRQGLAGNYG